MIKNGFIYVFFLLALFSSCKAQENERIDLSKIIFHVSRCNGTCPKISLEIDSCRNIYVDRTYYKTKSEIDSLHSGQFEGMLTVDEYQRLIKILEDCDLETLSFPEVELEDVSTKTVIVYYNGKRKQLKSVLIPIKAKDLIDFLSFVGNNKELKRTNKIRQICI